MYQGTFSYYNIYFKKIPEKEGVEVQGDITNNSGIDYSAAIFRIFIFIKGREGHIGSGVITIRGIHRKKTKSFNIIVRLEDQYIDSLISKYEIYLDSLY